MAVSRPDGPGAVYSITGAATPHSDDLNARMGKYLVSMAVRTACVVGAVVVGTGTWYFWVLVVGAVFLPYVAVLLANAGGSRRGAGPAAVDHRRSAIEAPAEHVVLEGTVHAPPRPRDDESR